MNKQPVMLNTSVLTEEEKKAALDRARRQMADEWAKAELGLSPGTNIAPRKGPPPDLIEEQCPITLNLYPGSDRIVIDGIIYLHGHSYTVGKSRYDLLSEIIFRGWEHQRQIDGKDGNAYRTEKNINAATGAPHRIPR